MSVVSNAMAGKNTARVSMNNMGQRVNSNALSGLNMADNNAFQRQMEALNQDNMNQAINSAQMQRDMAHTQTQATLMTLGPIVAKKGVEDIKHNL